MKQTAQVGCMRQALGPGALGRPRGIGCRGRWEGGSGWGTHVNPWLFHFNVWQNSLQIKKKKKKKKKASTWKRQGNRLQEGMQRCQYLDFSQVRLISDFWSQALKDNKFVLFSAIKFLVICYSSNGKLMHT